MYDYLIVFVIVTIATYIEHTITKVIKTNSQFRLANNVNKRLNSNSTSS